MAPGMLIYKITPHLRNISSALDKLFTDYENVAS